MAANRFGIFPRNDPQQELRLKRFFLATGAYLANTAFVMVCWSMGYFESEAVALYAVLTIAINLIFFGLIRSGLNKRFSDPSLTGLQVRAATLTVLNLMYFAGDARSTFLLLMLTILLFGLFRFRTRDFVRLAMFILAGYALLIGLLLHFRPGEINLKAEIMQWMAMFVTLVQFSTLAGLVSKLRFRVRENNKELEKRNGELLETNRRLEEAHNQLLQREKMASIGQLAAGVAHEINNPVGFVNSNVSTLEIYVERLLRLIDAYAGSEPALSQSAPERLAAIAQLKQEIEIDYLREDILALLSESKDGLMRVKKIVQDLKNFSHADTAEWQMADLHAGIDSTLNIVNNEIKYKATVRKEYAKLPDVECLPLEMNQVFMNILVNAAHAIDAKGEIVIRSGVQGDQVWIAFSDNGKGIPPENLTRIFDPFFTTKPVGQGTGLGLSLSYSIVRKHQGRIEVESKVGAGSTFRVVLPIRQDKAKEQAARAA